MQVRRLAALAILPVLAGCIAACSGKKNSGGEHPESSQRMVSVGIIEPQNLLPNNTSEEAGGQIIQALFAGLIEYDEDGKPVNLIADSITTRDSRVWTIKLKDGFTFHNGEKVIADSFIDAWNWGAYKNNGSRVNSYYSHIAGYDRMNPDSKEVRPSTTQLSGLRKIDNLSFEVTLSEPLADFNITLGHPAFFPLPKAAFHSDGGIVKEMTEAPIGNGPFKIRGRWAHDESIEVERFDGWKGTKPRVAGIKFKIYQSIESMYQDTVSNKLDIAPRIGPSNLPNAKEDFGKRYKTSPAMRIEFLAFPLYDSRFAKPEIRKAISMAIDREQIAKTIFLGTQKPAKSFIPPSVLGARADSCQKACTYNPAAAKALYQSAGGPAEISIAYNTEGGHKEWIEATCNQLQTNLGVSCKTRQEAKFSEMLIKITNKDPTLGLFRVGWGMDYPTMYNIFQPLFTSNGSSNYSGYSNPHFDRLVKDGAVATDHNEMIKLWQEAEDLLVQDLPLIPLRIKNNSFVYSKKIKNADVTLFGYVNPYTIETA